MAEDQEKLHPHTQNTRILPSKITPVLNNDDNGLSKAAPDIQTTEQSDDLSRLVLASNIEEDIPFFSKENLSQSDLHALFEGLSDNSQSPTLHKLVVTLLSGASYRTSTKPEDHHDIYTLRLTRLLQFGALDEVLALYKLNPASPPSSAAAKAGFIAMQSKEESGLACLEQMALPADIKKEDTDFWSFASLFCKGLLSPASGNDDNLRFTNAARIYITATSSQNFTSINEINNANPLTLMAMAQTGRLSPQIFTHQEITKLNNLSLSLLTEKMATDERTYLLLQGEAFKRGIISSKTLRERLTRLHENLLAKKEIKTNNYISLLAQILNENTIPTPQLFDKTVELIGEISILPLIIHEEGKEDGENNLPSMEWAAYKEENARFILATLIKTNQKAPFSLIEYLYPIKGSDFQENRNESGIDTKIILNHFLSNDQPPNLERKSLALAIAGNIEDSAMQKNSRNGVYDNILNLTESGNYVMPSNNILSNLKKNAEKKPSNQVVFESLKILSDQPMTRLNPAVLYRILGTFNSVGLSVETNALRQEVLGQLLEK